jgi:hypothetical protein
MLLDLRRILRVALHIKQYFFNPIFIIVLWKEGVVQFTKGSKGRIVDICLNM